jgi:hypothetical protein
VFSPRRASASARLTEMPSAPRFVCSLPEIIWEASLGIYLTFKGFKASAPS